MKKIVLTLTAFFVTLLTFAQSPFLMNYQGVARNAAGNVLPNQSISLKLNIRSGSPTGGVVYSETRTMLTNAFGLFNVVVGSPGATSVTGTIAGINWTAFGSGSGSKFLQVEIDPNGGSSFTSVGSTQLVSVPYALNAGSAAPVGPAGGDLTGTYPNPQIFFPLLKTFNAATLTPANTELIGMTNSATTGTLGAITGKSASTSSSANAITGTMTSTSPGAFSTAVRGVNNGTGGSGIGVWGSQDGSGWGVNGTSNSGIGVYGWSPSGVGTLGSSGTSTGIWGLSNTSNSGLFNNTNAANTAATVGITTNGTGPGLNSTTTGTGRAGWFEVNNAASTANALEASTNGVGASWAIRGNSSGTNGAGLFVQSNATNTANNVQSNQAGLGRAGFFQNTNTANNADALTGTTATTGITAAGVHGLAGNAGLGIAAKKGVWGQSDVGLGVFGTSNTSVGVFGASLANSGFAVVGQALNGGTGIYGTSATGPAANFPLGAGNASTVLTATTAGTGMTGFFENTNAANTSYTARMENANTSNVGAGNASLRVGRGPILANTFVFTGVPTASWGVASAGIGSMGSSATSLGVAGLTFSGQAVRGFSANSGAALVGTAANPAGFALVTAGNVQIQGLGAAPNRIFGATDAAGNGTWRTAASLGLVSGMGTLNYVPKWTPDGNTIGDSQLFDDGTNVGIGTTSPNGKLHVNNASTTSRGLQVNNTDNTNIAASAFVQTNHTANAVNFYENSAITATMPIGATTSMFVGATAVKAVSNLSTTPGLTSGIGVQGISGGGYGVIGVAREGTAVLAYNTTTGYGLQTFGRVQIEGQGAATNRILRSDATGNATWETLASINGVSGNGTLNYMTKWSPDGTTIANSQVFDNGVSLGVGTTTPNAAVRMDIQSTVSQMRLMDSDDNSELWFSAPGTAYTGGIGMATNHDLPLFTNSLDRMTIKANGLVGINTAAPVSMLDVDNTAAGQGGLRVNQPAELTVPAVKSLSDIITLDGSVAFPALMGTNSIYAQRGDFFGGTVILSALNETGIMGVSPAGTGTQGISVSGRGVFASSSTGVGLRAYSGSGAAIEANTGTGQAINTTGALQFAGIGEAAGRVLTSDAAGNATWQASAATTKVSIKGYGVSATFPTGAFTTITNWATIEHEEGGSNYNAGTGEYTIPVTGLYSIQVGGVYTASGSNGYAMMGISVNGSNSSIEYNLEPILTSSSFTGTSYTGTKLLNAGDVITINVYNGTSTPISISNYGPGPDARTTRFSISLLH